MPAVLWVCSRQGYVFYHTRKGLVPFEQRDKATKFKTLEHAVRLARKKYSRQLGYELQSWEVNTITEQEVSQ